MRWLRAIGSGALVVVVGSLVLTAGCEKKSPTGRTPRGGTAGGDTGDASEGGPSGDVEKKPWPAEVGSVAGVIRVSGNTPDMPRLDMSARPQCALLHGDETPRSELIVKSADGGLRDVFVYVSKGLEGYEVPPVGTEPVVLDQKGCIFVPRVFGVRVQQDIRILNSDAFLHNVKVNENRPMNEGMPNVGEMLKKKWFKRTQLGVSFQCEVHPWMRAYACIVDHPCYAVTDAEGKFKIENVPQGRYTIDFWHERAPGIKKPEPVEVEVNAGEEARVEASY